MATPVSNIEVDFEIVACCSVCPDGIGAVEVVNIDTIECDECGTTWDMRGRNGERTESED